MRLSTKSILAHLISKARPILGADVDVLSKDDTRLAVAVPRLDAWCFDKQRGVGGWVESESAEGRRRQSVAKRRRASGGSRAMLLGTKRPKLSLMSLGAPRA